MDIFDGRFGILAAIQVVFKDNNTGRRINSSFLKINQPISQIWNRALISAGWHRLFYPWDINVSIFLLEINNDRIDNRFCEDPVKFLTIFLGPRGGGSQMNPANNPRRFVR